jgi:hypothetical protein
LKLKIPDIEVCNAKYNTRIVKLPNPEHSNQRNNHPGLKSKKIPFSSKIDRKTLKKVQNAIIVQVFD